MRFILIDKIEELRAGEYIRTRKNLSLAEEYLADHFPYFAVMPGVLMLEALTQSAAWLIRVTDNFADSIVTLKEARNVKYGKFVTPGETLRLEVSILSREPGITKVKAAGYLRDEMSLSARLVMQHYNLSQTRPEHAFKDSIVVEDQKKIYELLRGD